MRFDPGGNDVRHNKGKGEHRPSGQLPLVKDANGTVVEWAFFKVDISCTKACPCRCRGGLAP